GTGPVRGGGRLRARALQRGSHLVLRLTVRRRVPVRAVPAAERQHPADALPRHLARLAAVAGSALDFARRSRGLLVVLEPAELLALPGAGVPGRQHARPLDAGLREIVRAY